MISFCICYKLDFDFFRTCPGGENLRLSPELGNVCFAASQMGWSFTLKSFAKMYSENIGTNVFFLMF
jgi:hypothetical protein